MNGQIGNHREGEGIGSVLRHAVGDQDFDYPALVAGTHQRAGRIRRRRTIVTGAVAAVLIPGLAGSAALIVPDLLEQESGTVGPAAPGIDGPSVTVLTEDEAQEAIEEAEEATGDAPQDEEAATETGPPPGEAVAPWQDGALPLPEGGIGTGSIENAWEIPDARPAGVGYLEEFGAPQDASDYPRLVPVSGVMMCNTGAEDAEPVAGQRWSYFQDGAGWADGTVDLHLTGWEDSQAAFEAIRDDTMTFCVRMDGIEWQEVTWEEREDDADYLLYEASEDTGLEHGFAVVRQGDYLIGVTVTDDSGEVNAEVAAEIGAKTADNLEALDPDHGRD